MTNQDLEKKVEKMDETTTVKELQQYIDEMTEVRGFTEETPRDIMLLLTEEIGELAKEIRKSTHLKTDCNKTKKLDVEGEIADVFSYLLSMCRVMNVDLVQAYKEKELRNCKREWK